ncbi:hypothetical protein SAMD00019534_026470 [Acytostelium subglobosum LB1]|uniref:hypothetical protein n=1 Tax=Acytostelium subglobosum LB1 TaxID=1410327 RepID=UPI000644F88B|nr:hypothetical protein SAMD00019534_026470 [Acytostelium subglobosum LB1]GAM19472.1 hypothetical protein SAMD00019534_026470 [Acytostelium subglobosum LB1]|eukprot:XP_012757399.1 hypothetical protein SAMD00019534_026470 [Acytostelium subglobosum LB1]
MDTDADTKKQILSSLSHLDDRSLSFKVKLDHLNRLVDLKKYVTDLSKLIPIAQFLKSVRVFLASPPKTMRTSALRVIRYYATTSKFIQEIVNLKIHYFITRSLERDKHSEAERIQALKLIRTIMEIDCSQMPPCIVKTLVAIAENQEDNFCRVCLETLCEVAIRNPQTTAQSNGIRMLFDAVLDPFYHGTQESLLIAILYILNEERTRVFVRPTSDLEIILSPLTNSLTLGIKIKGLSKEKEKEKEKDDELNMKKWTGSIKAVITLLKSWIGIISLASDEQGLKSIVDALKMPQLELNDKILDALFDIFKFGPPKSGDPFRQQKASQSLVLGPDSLIDLPLRVKSSRHNLLNNYIAVLLISFIDCGLIEGLAHLGNLTSASNKDGLMDLDKELSKSVATKATVLLGELLYISNSLLPSSQCAKLQTLPAIVNSAISFRLDPRLRSRSSTMVTNLHSYSHIKASSNSVDQSVLIGLTGADKWRRVRGQDRRLDKVDAIKVRMDYQMDDMHFQAKIKDTQVLVTKDFLKWNWELILEILEGPLKNSVHMANVLKTKFIKRVLSFLRPSNKSFTSMAWTPENLKYVRVACVLLEVLISHECGNEFLKDNKTIVQIADMLRLEMELNQSPSSPPKTHDKGAPRLLSQEKVLKTMAREYFTMLGTLSSQPNGLNIVNRHHIFDYLRPLAELSGRDDLSHAIITSLDYNLCGDSRLILQRTLTSSNSKVVVRYLATKYMRFLFRAGVQDFCHWGIEYLVQQLNDNDSKVSILALNVLDEACDDPDCFDTLIKLKPPLLKLGKPGKSLLLRFLSRTNGLNYLKEINFVDQEQQLWLASENANYVISVENAISEALTPLIYRQREADQGNNCVYLPPHFFGELAKTEEGCFILRRSNNFAKFVKMAKDELAHPLERRAAIFAIGQVCSSQPGFQFLVEFNVVPLLVELAEKSPCLSLRGTCFYALGMISSIEAAAEILEKHGWESPTDLSNRISVPKDLNKSTFLKVAPYEYKGSWANTPFDMPTFSDPLKQEIIGYVINLASHITAETASKNLKRLKVKSPEYFASGEMLSVILAIMDHYRFRLGARRFIYDCFDTAIFSDDPFPYIEQYHNNKQQGGTPTTSTAVAATNHTNGKTLTPPSLAVGAPVAAPTLKPQPALPIKSTTTPTNNNNTTTKNIAVV